MPKYIKLPELQRLCRAISAATDEADIHRRLSFVFSCADIINYETPHAEPIWRARKCQDANGFSTVGELGCPPAATTQPNRLNDAGNPLLYVSTTMNSALEEVRASPGDHLHLVGYSMGDRTVRTAIVGEYTSVFRWGRARLGDTMSNVIRALLQPMPHEPGKSALFTDAFLSQLLRDSDASKSNYVRSRLIARLIFERLPDIDAITYPGVALEGAMNMAFKPASASRLLEPIRK